MRLGPAELCVSACAFVYLLFYYNDDTTIVRMQYTYERETHILLICLVLVFWRWMFAKPMYHFVLSNAKNQKQKKNEEEINPKTTAATTS